MTRRNYKNLKIQYKTDIRIFLLFCVLNYLGYDIEYRKRGMHPVRTLARNDLKIKKIETDKEIKIFLTKSYPSGFTRMILQLGNPPKLKKILKKWNFDSKYYSGETKKINIVGFLQFYYKKLEIDKLWRKYYPYYLKEINNYKTTGWEREIKTFLENLRLKKIPFNKIVLIPNLLDTNWTACNVLLGEKSFLVLGPRLDRGKKSLILMLQHEILHSIINPLLSKKNVSMQLKKTEKLFLKIKNKTKKQYYLDWNTVVTECIIRAIILVEKKYKCNAERIEYEIKYNKQMGFHYLDYFFNKMIGFKKAKKTTLENYIPKIIKEFSAYLKK